MVIGLKRVLYFILRLSPFGITVIFAAWLLLQSPFAAPLLDRSIEQSRSAITSAIARKVDLGWLLPRIQDAILAQDLGQILLLLRLANDHGVQLPDAMLADIMNSTSRQAGFGRAPQPVGPALLIPPPVRALRRSVPVLCRLS